MYVFMYRKGRKVDLKSTGRHPLLFLLGRQPNQMLKKKGDTRKSIA